MLGVKPCMHRDSLAALFYLSRLLVHGLRLILQQKRSESGVALAGGVRRLLKGARLPRLHKARGGHDSLLALP